MIRIVSVKFRPAGRHYDFDAQDFDLETGGRVIVETNRGRALGTVVLPPRKVPRLEAPEDIKKVLRVATDEDIALSMSASSKEGEAFRFCLQRIKERKMEMKLVRAEYLFDGSKIIFYFTADGRVDFRELVKDLAHHFHTRIEMRQIGVRDEAKLTGGIGICGRELCCCTFLNEFTPVSVKMAKEQGLALNPNKISGQCGRLLCCLSYEFETYGSLKKNLPKCGCRVHLEGREGEIVGQNVLAQKVTVKLEDGQLVETSAEKVEKDQRSNPLPAVATPSPSKVKGGETEEAHPETPAEKEPSGPRQEQPEQPEEKTQAPTDQSSRKKSKKNTRGRRRQRRK
jgi:cell fate regulator YaaT (PSP1 superfamily)